MTGATGELWWWQGFPVAFVLTCVIEIPAYLAVFVALGWVGRGPAFSPLRVRSAVGLAAGVNLISHPLLWGVATQWPRPGVAVLAELGVVALEGLLVFATVRRFGRVADSTAHYLRWGVFSALSVNALSVSIGLWLLPAIMSVVGFSAFG
jgi:hypothetical protein